MAILTVSQYAEKVGKSPQAVTKAIRAGKLKNLKGVTKVEKLEGKKQPLYILTYESDEPEPYPYDNMR